MGRRASDGHPRQALEPGVEGLPRHPVEPRLRRLALGVDRRLRRPEHVHRPVRHGRREQQDGLGRTALRRARPNAAAWSGPREALRSSCTRPEAILVEELPILPIYYYVTQNVVSPRLGYFHENIQDEHFPKFWYWMDDEELASSGARYPAENGGVKTSGPRTGSIVRGSALEDAPPAQRKVARGRSHRCCASCSAARSGSRSPSSW